MFRAIITGAPGSGKGTIATRIVRDFGLKHLSSGDLFRSQILSKTVAGLEAQKYIQQGQLVPDELTIKLIVAELETMKSNPWLLDGFPRTLSQAKSLNAQTSINQVVYLNVPFDVIIDRIRGRWTHAPSGRIYHTEFNPPKVAGKDDVTGEDLIQREDDKPETVLKRLKSYQDQINPVLTFYKDLNVLQEFKGTESNEIWPRVRDYLLQRIPKKL